MFNTLKQIVDKLPSSTIIHPGHHYAEQTTSTMEEQLAGNPFMHFDRLDDFVRYRTHFHDKHRDSPYRAVAKGEEFS